MPTMCCDPPPGSVLRDDVVWIAVQPPLARFGRGDDGVASGLGVCASMSIGRGVAAEGGAAGLARAQVHPLRAGLHALVALAHLRRLDVGNPIDMWTVRVGAHTALSTSARRSYPVTFSGFRGFHPQERAEEEKQQTIRRRIRLY